MTLLTTPSRAEVESRRLSSRELAGLAPRGWSHGAPVRQSLSCHEAGQAASVWKHIVSKVDQHSVWTPIFTNYLEYLECLYCIVYHGSAVLADLKRLSAELIPIQADLQKGRKKANNVFPYNACGNLALQRYSHQSLALTSQSGDVGTSLAGQQPRLMGRVRGALGSRLFPIGDALQCRALNKQQLDVLFF